MNAKDQVGIHPASNQHRQVTLHWKSSSSEVGSLNRDIEDVGVRILDLHVERSRLSGLSRGTVQNGVIAFPKRLLRTLRSVRSPVSTSRSSHRRQLTFETLVGNHRIIERLVILIHHSLLVAFTNDFTRVTPREVVHRPERVEREEDRVYGEPDNLVKILFCLLVTPLCLTHAKI